MATTLWTKQWSPLLDGTYILHFAAVSISLNCPFQTESFIITYSRLSVNRNSSNGQNLKQLAKIFARYLRVMITWVPVSGESAYVYTASASPHGGWITENPLDLFLGNKQLWQSPPLMLLLHQSIIKEIYQRILRFYPFTHTNP